MSTPEEMVACVPSYLANEYHKDGEISLFRGSLFKHAFSRPRSTSERDPLCKQLVTYTVLLNVNSRKVFSYSRAGSENRLDKLLSLGVGGHVSGDLIEKYSFAQYLPEEAFRELNEEVVVSCPDHMWAWGVINDNSNDVGLAHLGILFVLPCRSAYPEEDHLRDGNMIDIDAIASQRQFYEPWSKIVIDSLVLPTFI